MNTLTEADIKLLDQLDLPQKQRDFIETHWRLSESRRQSESKMKERFSSFAYTLISPSIAAILLCGHFREDITSLVNIALLAVCLLIFGGLAGFAGLAGNAFYLMMSEEIKKKKLLLSRTYISGLAGPRGFIKYRNRLTWLSFIILPATLGHIGISFFAIMALILTWPMKLVSKAMVEIALRDLTKQDEEDEEGDEDDDEEEGWEE